MPDRSPDNLQKKIEERLRFYEDLGVLLFYRDRQTNERFPAASANAASIVAPPPIAPEQEIPLRKTASPSTSVDLFAEVAKIKDDTLLRIREDIGDCTRCKLHKGRNKIVFGDGNPRAKLVFVGEAPGADEDKQGIPFVGRAGKLLTLSLIHI